MKKMIAEVYKLPSGSLMPQMYCIESDGNVNRAVTDTLLSLVTELNDKMMDELEALVSASEVGTYRPVDPDLPDWGINDKNVWLMPPKAKPGCLCVSNEYVPDYSDDDGEPQQFTRQQFRQALAHWKSFQKLIQERGLPNMIGHRVEVQLD